MSIRSSLLAYAILTCLVFSPIALQAANPHFSAIYVFGDSYCDVGNLYDVSGLAPAPPYYPGRRSNGPLWVEHIASAWGLPMAASLAGGTDYAWAGAEVINPIPVPGLGTIPNVPQQVAAYLAKTGGKADPNALYILEGGGNDIIDANGSGSPQQLGFQIAFGLASVELQLRHAGAKNFLIPELFDVGLLPAAAPNNAFARAASIATNENLANMLRLEELIQGVQINRLKVFGLMDAVTQSTTHFGFINVTTPCLDAALNVCPDPDHTFFWDTYHPTVFGHSFFAVTAETLYAAH
jgi:outer membrane lipase/esterase